MHLADEVLDHFLRNLKIGNDPISQRSDRFDIAGRTTQHHLGLVTDRQHLFAALDVSNGNDRRFVQHDAAAFDINKRIGGPKVNRHVGRQHPK